MSIESIAPAREAAAPSLNKRLKQWLAWPFVLAVGFFWWQSVRGLPLVASLAQVRGNEGWLALALVAAALYLVGQAVVWRAIVGDLLGPLPWRGALRAWMVSNMGRYLPGSVWHLVGRVMMGQGAGVNRAAGALGVLLEQGLQLLAALLIVGASLPFWPAGSVVRAWAWVALLVPLGFLVIHPRLFFPLLNGVLRRLGRTPVPATLGYGAMVRYTLYYVLVHLANGAALACAVVALRGPLPVVPAVVGGALFAWTVGYLTIFSPGGLGLRELLVTEALGPVVGREVAAVAALLWRLANLLTEALGALLFEFLWRRVGTP